MQCPGLCLRGLGSLISAHSRRADHCAPETDFGSPPSHDALPASRHVYKHVFIMRYDDDGIGDV
eukprot:scaffold138116_cov148-Phaeocystis_antarctica.AAC.2